MLGKTKPDPIKNAASEATKNAGAHRVTSTGIINEIAEREDKLRTSNLLLKAEEAKLAVLRDSDSNAPKES